MKVTMTINIDKGDSLARVIDELEHIMLRLPAAKFSYAEDLQLEFDEELER